MLRAALVAIAVVVGVRFSGARQDRSASPPLPFEDVGACPFEGCTYREWVASAPMTIRTERRDSAPIAYRVRKGERVLALTGVVVTLTPGRVQFRAQARLDSATGPIQIAPGETLYLLTYQGEGFTKAWFKGHLYSDVDVTDFLDGACDTRPSRCAGRLIERSRTEWWVRVRNQLGKEGWTRDTQKFDGKDALAE